MVDIDKYEKAGSERQKAVDAVVKSGAKMKVVVAGPGTGKTYLFKKILDGKKKTLTITFVNSLVEDLSLELFGLSEVRTLHSFARSVLKDAKVFPKLSAVIREDAKILKDEDIAFDDLFHNREDGDKRIEFYNHRRTYYGGYYGYTDIIYDAVKLMEDDDSKIPEYQQVVVDEFQDFNKLEVSLIDLLAKKNAILLAGDDDQALYGFKGASTEHIRCRHQDPKNGYEAFNLPYCSRSTRVIVDAINDLVAGAQNEGHLVGRIQKPYLYFDDKQKDVESAKYSKITHVRMYATQIPWFIDSQIAKIAEEARASFSALVMSPTRNQCKSISETLKKKGYRNVHYTDKQGDEAPALLDGLKLLLKDRVCKLGWRIVLRSLLAEDEFKRLLERTADGGKHIMLGVAAQHRKRVNTMLKILRAVRDGAECENEELNGVLELTEFAPIANARGALKEELDASGQVLGKPGVRKIPIHVTTILSAKGLADDYVFITHFDDLFFLSEKGKIVRDRDVCNFLVALTRARKKVFLISTQKEDPTFKKWIDQQRIENLG